MQKYQNKYLRTKFTGNQSRAFKGYGEIGASYFQTLQFSAKTRGYDFNVTIQQIWDLFLKQNRKCKLTGEKLYFNSQKQIARGFEQTASLDRIDNSKSYTIDNIQWLHKSVNIMKGKGTDQELINLCKKITNYQQYKIDNPTQEIYIEERKKKWDYNYFEIMFTYQRLDGRNILRDMFCAKCACGKIFKGKMAYIFHKRPLTGCGCGYADGNQLGNTHSNWKGCGLVGLYYFTELKRGAEERHLEFTITIENLWELYKKQNGQCWYSGDKLTFASQNGKKKGLLNTASVDRIDSNKGYTTDNVRWVHKDINWAKKKLSEERFLELCRKIAKNN